MRSWHNRNDGRWWRVTPQGVEVWVGGRVELYRTPGEPLSIQRYLTHWLEPLVSASNRHRVPLSLLLMTAATENGPARIKDGAITYVPVRIEPGWESDQATPHRVSVGPMHLLLSTAGMTRVQLLHLRTNLDEAARYIASQKPKTGFDPVLVAAAYNAGGIYRPHRNSRFANPWNIRFYGDHIDRAARWYGDACAVIVGSDVPAVRDLDAAGLGRVVTEGGHDGDSGASD